MDIDKNWFDNLGVVKLMSTMEVPLLYIVIIQRKILIFLKFLGEGH